MKPDRESEVTFAILYPWIGDALQLLHEARRRASMNLQDLQRAGLAMPAITSTLSSFIERADRVLKEASK